MSDPMLDAFDEPSGQQEPFKASSNNEGYKGKKINVANLGDHRICMSSFILGLITGAKTKIKNFETVFTSAPNFLNKMKLLGAKFDIQK